jgi:hypothetical protein
MRSGPSLKFILAEMINFVLNAPTFPNHFHLETHISQNLTLDAVAPGTILTGLESNQSVETVLRKHSPTHWGAQCWCH